MLHEGSHPQEPRPDGRAPTARPRVRARGRGQRGERHPALSGRQRRDQQRDGLRASRTRPNDVLDGNDGSDFINGAAGVDNLQGADDNDTIVGGVNSDTIIGGSGLDDLSGNDGNDVIEGNTGDDDLRGNAGDDTLLGGAQADDLIGGIGRDSLSGGTGNDNLNADDNAGGDDLDCGEHLFDNDLAVFNLGDTVASDCERQRVEP